MNLVKKIEPKKSIIILTISLCVAVINILLVLIGVTKTPPGSEYLAVGHFYYDYFEYIQQMVQGMRGRLTVNNPFTPLDQSETIIGWGQYLLFGKLAVFFNWSVYFTYWFIVFIGSFILAILLYIVIKRIFKNQTFIYHLITWLMVIFATPFVKINFNEFKIIPFEFWYSPMSLFHRFGGVPHHMLTNILIVVLLLSIAGIITNIEKLDWRKIAIKAFIIGSILILLLTFAPFQVINIMSALIITVWIFINILIRNNKKQSWKKLLFFTGFIVFFLVPAAFITLNLHGQGELFARAIAWETAQQHYPKLSIFLLTTGPILIFIPFGLKSYFHNITPLKLLVFFFTIFSYVYFYTPISLFFGTHNLRFLNPIAYLGLGMISIEGIRTISNWFKFNKTIFYTLTLSLISYFVFITYIIYKSFFGVDQLSFMPKDLITGIKIIDNNKDNKAVLTSPRFALGLILPCVIDRKVYLGRPIFTPDYGNRSEIVEKIYQGLYPTDQTKQLILENNIGYAVIDQREGHDAKGLETYGFFNKIYENSQVKIYKVEL